MEYRGLNLAKCPVCGFLHTGTGATSDVVTRVHFQDETEAAQYDINRPAIVLGDMIKHHFADFEAPTQCGDPQCPLYPPAPGAGKIFKCRMETTSDLLCISLSRYAFSGIEKGRATGPVTQFKILRSVKIGPNLDLSKYRA